MSDPLKWPGRVRIECDGTVYGTRVTCADTGEEIPCTKVVLTIDPQKGLSELVLTVVAPRLSYEGPATRVEEAQ